MTDPAAARPGPPVDDDTISLLALGSAFLRRRRMIMALGFLGLVVGLAMAVIPPPVYRSTAVFKPQVSDARTSNMAILASRIGLTSAEGNSEWGPPVYVELVKMWSLLEPLVRDTLTVAELDGQAVALLDLLSSEGPSPEQRIDQAVSDLRELIKSREISSIGAVELSVTSRWPSVSLFLVQQLVDAVNLFNIDTRRSQAAEEHAFVAKQVQEAKENLHVAENRLLLFLQHNRAITGSPELVIEHDRLQREVSLRQQLYTALLQNLEESRIKVVRDTPVITILESPQLALEPEPRLLFLKIIIGWLVGGILGMILAILVEGWQRAVRQNDDQAREFLNLFQQAVPRFLHRGYRDG